MKTRVTLDSDLAAKLNAMAHERGISFDQALNQAVRAGLRPGRGASSPFQPYTQPMGLRAGLEIDKALHLAAGLEDEEMIRTPKPRGPGS